MSPHRPSLVLLDIDGTLVDSNDAHALAWVEALAAHGHRHDVAAVRRLIGMGGDQLLPQLGLDPDSPEGQAISHRRGQIFAATYLPAIRPLPAARPFVERLLAEGFSVRTATSAQDSELRPLLQIAQVDDLLLKGASSGDVEASKPAPDVLHVALTRAKTRPRDALLIGDTPYDLECARRAGVRALAVRSGGWPEPALAHALAVYDDLADLLRHWDTSPLALPPAPSAA